MGSAIRQLRRTWTLFAGRKSTRLWPGVTAVGMSDSLLPVETVGATTCVIPTSMLWVNRTRLREPAERGFACRDSRLLSRPSDPNLQGAGFSEVDRQSSGHPIVLSELLAAGSFLKGTLSASISSAGVHSYLAMDGPVYTIVGIAGNVKNGGLAGGDDPKFFTLTRPRRDWDNHQVYLIQIHFHLHHSPWLELRLRNSIASPRSRSTRLAGA